MLIRKNRLDSDWNIIASKKNLDPADLAYFKGTESFTIQYFDKQKYDVSIFLPLADQSFLGILIGHKMDKSEFNDLDKITLQDRRRTALRSGLPEPWSGSCSCSDPNARPAITRHVMGYDSVIGGAQTIIDGVAIGNGAMIGSRTRRPGARSMWRCCARAPAPLPVLGEAMAGRATLDADACAR